MGDRTGGNAPAESGEPFFAPIRREARPVAEHRAFGVRRLAVRIAVCVLALVVLDRVIAPSFAPPAAYLHAYRLPSTAPTAALADYANAIELASRVPGHAPIALFLGASPTYGHRIKDSSDTFPYAYESAAASAGVAVTAFNVASNGQFVADYYVLDKRLLAAADIVFVQLTYHTFAPAGRAGLHIRYPELPTVLGVELTAADDKLLGLRAGTVAQATAASPVALSGALGAWWTLWRERDLIDRRLFGGHPRTALEAFVGKATGTSAPSAPASTTTLPGVAADDGFASFDSLSPGKQMVVVARYAEESSFTIDPADSEVVMLGKLAADVAGSGKRAVFFMGPLNQDVIGSYGLIDTAQYRSNIALLRRTVARHGFTLIDHNTDSKALPGSDFADISHTTDAGGARFGATLFADTRSYVRAVTP